MVRYNQLQPGTRYSLNGMDFGYFVSASPNDPHTLTFQKVNPKMTGNFFTENFTALNDDNFKEEEPDTDREDMHDEDIDDFLGGRAFKSRRRTRRTRMRKTRRGKTKRGRTRKIRRTRRPN